MVTISDNDKGNPYHDEEGKFTTEGGQGSAKPDFPTQKMMLKPGADLSGLPKIGEKKPGMKIKAGINLEQLKAQMQERQAMSRIPRLSSANDIINNIEKFITAPFVKDLDANYQYGSSYSPYLYSPFTFSDGTKGLKVNMFVQLMSKYRYNAEYCRTIPYEEYVQIVQRVKTYGSGSFEQFYDGNYSRYRGSSVSQVRNNFDPGCGFVLGFRGVQFYSGANWRTHLKECLNSYIGYHTSNPTYGSQGCYGTVNYMALSNSYAHSYDGSQGHILKHVVDLNKANIMYEDEVKQIQRDLLNNSTVLQQKLEKAFAKHVSPDKARALATGFIGSIRYDFGHTCVLMGGDCVLCGLGNGNQLDILNWNIARILKDW